MCAHTTFDVVNAALWFRCGVCCRRLEMPLNLYLEPSGILTHCAVGGSHTEGQRGTNVTPISLFRFEISVACG